ncbi:hypothetical protein EJ08DRAFT_597308 [Tothia fuscella]|uniref:FHA domain-containing protein n=1 Tax=Tothia fuscella TaxID=1048955 RepID=A0A9P4TUE2_9PEZI|nr:hypothetical protein EJ08DRAFT_597308 [Tothia fuscella]
MLLPQRKQAQRSNSSSSLNSLSSNSSNASTISAASSSSVLSQSNGGVGAASAAGAGGGGDWENRKRTTARSLWPASKAEPIAGLSTARPQSIASTSGPSAASAISALHTPSNMALQNAQNQVQQQNGLSRPQQQMETPPAVLYLTPMNGTFERKTITVPFFPDVLRIGRQTNNKTLPTPQNGYFDSKVLSRQHAEIWADRSGKVFIRDVKSSNGTFVNGQRLSQENKDSDPHELREQDMLELGIDIVSEDQKTVVHHKVAARVEHAGFYGGNAVLDLNFGDLDPSATAGLMNGTLGQGAGQMRRTGSQSSIGSNSRMSVASSQTGLASAQQRQQHFWLQPVTMDKVIQKLNSEFKAAQQQSLDLHRTAQCIDIVLKSKPITAPPASPKKEKTSPIEKPHKTLPSIKDSLKARFSDPPAPPPDVPLPEKPDFPRSSGSGFSTSMFAPSSLSRIDTERPRLGSANSSPVGAVTVNGANGESSLASAAQIANLVDSLSKTKQEVEVQNARLREVEDLLVQERIKREDAEEKVKRVERERRNSLQTQYTASVSSTVDAASPRKDEENTTPIDDEKQDQKATADEEQLISTKSLQDRLDKLLVEFKEVKDAAERWKREKEAAEQERDEERKERTSLAEMVASLRAQETERIEKEKKRDAKRGRSSRRSRSTSPSSVGTGSTVVDSQELSAPTATAENGRRGVADLASKDKSAGEQNGHATAVGNNNHGKGDDVVADATRELVRRGEQLAVAAPYLSAVSVVLIGVAVMALVNRMQNGEGVRG